MLFVEVGGNHAECAVDKRGVEGDQIIWEPDRAGCQWKSAGRKWFASDSAEALISRNAGANTLAALCPKVSQGS
jgi:hypothetical protein